MAIFPSVSALCNRQPRNRKKILICIRMYAAWLLALRLIESARRYIPDCCRQQTQHKSWCSEPSYTPPFSLTCRWLLPRADEIVSLNRPRNVPPVAPFPCPWPQPHRRCRRIEPTGHTVRIEPIRNRHKAGAEPVGALSSYAVGNGLHWIVCFVRMRGGEDWRFEGSGAGEVR